MVYMFLATGFEEVEALAPLDIMRRAGVEVTTVGIGGELITGAHGITVKADIADSVFRDDAPEMVILPGGMPGTRNLDASPVVEAALNAVAANDGYLAAICAAPMVLGKRGLLKGKRAICYPGFEKFLDGARLSHHNVVRDGNVITAAGMGVAIEFGLEIVEMLCGDVAAANVRAAIIAG